MHTDSVIGIFCKEFNNIGYSVFSPLPKLLLGVSCSYIPVKLCFGKLVARNSLACYEFSLTSNPQE